MLAHSLDALRELPCVWASERIPGGKPRLIGADHFLAQSEISCEAGRFVTDEHAGAFTDGVLVDAIRLDAAKLHLEKSDLLVWRLNLCGVAFAWIQASVVC